MKKLLLALLLAIVSSSAVAEWVYIVENKTTGTSYTSIPTLFANPATRLKCGNW